MAEVKVFEAATEGFRLIRREPKAVLVWSAVLFLVLGIPGVLLMRSMAPRFAALSEATGEGASAGMMAAQGQMFTAMPLIWLLSIIAYVVVGGAALRAVITPDDRRFFYMRLGKAELWMTLSAIVGIVLFYIASLIIGGICTVVIGIAVAVPLGIAMGAQGVSENSQSLSFIHWAIVLAAIAVYVADLYFMMRFSMAPLMSFDQRRFRLFGSWRFTRGAGWRLLGLVLVMFLAILIVELVFVLVFFAGAAPTFTRLITDPTAALELERQAFAFYASPMMWPVAIVGGVLGGAYMALMFAPWARVYLMLKDSVAAPPDAVESQA